MNKELKLSDTRRMITTYVYVLEDSFQQRLLKLF